jgi:predicted peptidase
MRHTLFIVIFALFSCCGLTYAQHSTHPDNLYGNTPEVIDLTTTINGQEYPCAVIINTHATKGGPAILFLHGYGECGTDNMLQRTVGLPKHAIENPELWPFVLIVPQKPIHNSEWENHEHALIHFLDEARKQGLYDPDRLAITGLSQGGHGTIMMTQRHPTRFVAAAPVCGYLRPFFTEERERIDQPAARADMPEYKSAAQALREVPVWFWHGDADPVVPVDESRALHKALKATEADTKYTELPGADHNAWDPAYSSKELAAWFAKHLSAD